MVIVTFLPTYTTAYTIRIAPRGKTCFFEDLRGEESLAIRFDVDEAFDEFGHDHGVDSGGPSWVQRGTSKLDIGFWVSPSPPLPSLT